MEMVRSAKGQLFQDILDQLKSDDYQHGSVLTSDEELALLSRGLLQPYIPNEMLSVEEREAELTRLGKVILITEHDSRYHSHTLDIATLRKDIEKLDGKQTVSANEKKHTGQHKPQQEAGKWQRSIAPKYEDTVGVLVRVEPDTRDKFHAVMRAKETNAQEFLSKFIDDVVKQNPDLVEKGEHMEAQGHKKAYRSKLEILKEENTRLRDMAAAGTSHRST